MCNSVALFCALQVLAFTALSVVVNVHGNSASDSFRFVPAYVPIFIFNLHLSSHLISIICGNILNCLNIATGYHPQKNVDHSSLLKRKKRGYVKPKSCYFPFSIFCSVFSPVRE